MPAEQGNDHTQTLPKWCKNKNHSMQKCPLLVYRANAEEEELEDG
jgi:hypothetical protein